VRLSDALEPVKSVYVAANRGAGRLLTRMGLLPEQAPPLAHRRRHWLHSLTLIHDSMALAAIDVPWWTYASIAAMTDWIAERPEPVRVYEYGSGASTFWLARRVAEVHSVEHHRAFGTQMQSELAEFDNVSLRIVEPIVSDSPVVPSAKEGHGELDFQKYVESIDDVEGQFDLIVIDGRAREACLSQAIPRLKDDGIILFDNSLRRRYRRSIKGAAVRERRLPGLTPTLPYPDQTSLLTLRR
jgi:predicted O-methyltransferase YrrM